MGPVRIFQTERFLPKCCELFFAVFLDVHNLWRVVDTLAVLKHRNHQLADGVAVRGQMGLFPGFNRVEEQQGFAGIVLFVYQADQVCDDLAGFLIIDTADSLVARVVIFSAFSESLIFGMNLPVSLSRMAASL